MTTIVNSTAPTNNSNGTNLLIGILAITVFVILFLYFGVPAMQNIGPLQLNVPAPNVVVPEKIDVNIKQTK